QRTFETLQSLGVKFVPITVPDFTTDVSASAIESAVFFEELVRTGKDKGLTNPGRSSQWRNNRLTPAVEYLQSQRVRMMMMMKLADATKDVDVYLGPGSGANNTGGGGRGARGGGSDVEARPSAGARHSAMANLATYPGVNIRNGFSEAGEPTSITFFARPFGETELLALAKAYQDATDFHLKQPNLAAGSSNRLLG